MSVDLFRKVVAEISPWVDSLYLHVLGEPLMHPHFQEMVNIAYEASLPIHLVTNAVLLKGNRMDWVLHPGITEINISLQSFASSEGEAKLEQYLRGVLDFCLHAENLRPDLRINLRIWNLSDYSQEAFDENIYLNWIKKVFGKDIFVGKIAENVHSRGVNIRGNLSVNFSQRFEWPSMANKEVRKTGYCAGMTQQFGILVDGRVVPCCLDDKAAVELGNINERSFLEIMNSPRAKKMFEGFEMGILTESLCRRCEFGMRFKRKIKRGINWPK
ncbi:MAG: radical SAM/SPASM domain-containing protein, partial [Lentisphaeria bacterium]